MGFAPALSLVCTDSAQESANPEQVGQTHCQQARHLQAMAKIIPIRFRRPLLPRRLLRDGWWLETPARSNVIAQPKRNGSESRPKSKIRHLTLITSGN